MGFEQIKEAVQKQFDLMVATGNLFKTEVTKDELWETYLDSFPEGTNNIYRERTEHDCQCCKQFIRACGNVVAIKDNKMISIWDVELSDDHQGYQTVANAMSKLVKSYLIRNRFAHYQAHLGTDHNIQLTEYNIQQTETGTIRWDHFHYILPQKFVARKDDIGSLMGIYEGNHSVCKRGLNEITTEAIETVIELIDQKSIYRGEEFKGSVSAFAILKADYDNLSDPWERENFCWVVSEKVTSGSRIRNTAIGTLLTDLSNGEELDSAVGAFEAKVAPTNYKRPTALITKGMIAKAEKKVEELGILGALSRRYATVEDLTINNVLFADRTAKEAMNVFDDLAGDTVDKLPKNLDKVEKVSIHDFVNRILPKATAIDLMLDNNHTGNLVSLVAPQDSESKHIFKWGNNFSWSYNGEVTDSIKERVKNAGGNVNGVLRCSLSWFNYDDLDIHVIEPGGNEIFYGKRRNFRTTGRLDVDMNVNAHGSRNAVENLVWTNKCKMQEGVYNFFVHQYRQRESIDVGFVAELEFDNQVYTFHYDRAVRQKVDVLSLEFSRDKGFKILKSLPTTQASKEVWGLNTMKFHKVSTIMYSPNHWDGEKTGNKHYFFMLDGCKNEDRTRGFFNEFLNEELQEHRKVFEVLGAKMRTERSDNQLSGVGFSSTQKNRVFCKVQGSFNRIIEIIF